VFTPTWLFTTMVLLPIPTVGFFRLRRPWPPDFRSSIPLTTEPWGVRRFFLVDPNGVVINVMSHET